MDIVLEEHEFSIICKNVLGGVLNKGRKLPAFVTYISSRLGHFSNQGLMSAKRIQQKRQLLPHHMETLSESVQVDAAIVRFTATDGFLDADGNTSFWRHSFKTVRMRVAGIFL